MDLFDRLARVLGENLFEQGAHPEDLLGGQLDIGGHATRLGVGLVDQHPGMRQCQPLALGTRSQQDRIFNAIKRGFADNFDNQQAGDEAEWRLVPIGTAGLGTYFTGVGLGMYGEVGWNLVEALGASSLRAGLNAASTLGVGPMDGCSVAFFGGLEGDGVARYLPLDGTVFKDSRELWNGRGEAS